MQMKRGYLQQVLDRPKPRREHNDEMEDCDKDFTKPARSAKSKRPTIRRKWIEKESFHWEEEQQVALKKVKQARCRSDQHRRDAIVSVADAGTLTMAAAAAPPPPSLRPRSPPHQEVPPSIQEVADPH